MAEITPAIEIEFLFGQALARSRDNSSALWWNARDIAKIPVFN